MADNVDHDTATLDGRGTFHGMGIIASVTPGVKAARRVPRRDVSLKDIKAIGQIKIHFFRPDKTGLSGLTFKALPAISANVDSNLDLLSKVSWPLKNPCPAWSGLMQMELGEMLHEDLGDASLNAVQKLLEDLLAGRMS
ncbi:hypothetical protein ACOMHN_054656 [Nucella lapillus]